MVGTARRIPNQSDFFSPRASSLRSLCLLLDGICQSSLAEASSLMCPATAVLVVGVYVNGTLMYVVTGRTCDVSERFTAADSRTCSPSRAACDHGDKPSEALAVLLPSARVGMLYGSPAVLAVTREASDREPLFGRRGSNLVQRANGARGLEK